MDKNVCIYSFILYTCLIQLKVTGGGVNPWSIGQEVQYTLERSPVNLPNN